MIIVYLREKAELKFSHLLDTLISLKPTYKYYYLYII